jgi:hypothetical protein
LVEYLIPPKSTATTQGEHVFFDIDVKGGEKEWYLDATVGGPNRLVQPLRVSINAKGGDCWHVLQERVCLSLMERTEGRAEGSVRSGGGENNKKRSQLRKESAVQKRMEIKAQEN